MKILASISSKATVPFDRLCNLLIDESDLNDAEKNLKNSEKNSVTTKVYESLDSLDTKSTAVLTHVSVMLAATGFLFSESQGFLRWSFGIEAILYILITLVCLRLIIAPNDNNYHLKEVAWREAVFAAVAKLTILISVLFAVTVLAELIVGNAK